LLHILNPPRELIHILPDVSNFMPVDSQTHLILGRLGRDHNIPFLAPWKKNLTMKTWSPAMVRMSPLSIKLNLKMRPSVLLTVLKFLFSRVRFLVAGDCGQLCRQLEDGLFENRGLFGAGALLGGNDGACSFVLDLGG
jgi:hypothetical protein